MQPARRRTALAGILAAVFVSGTGIGSILPILPLYLRERGASYALVGVVVAAALVAQAVGQWPAGWLADRLGRREMMVAGLLLSAAASLVFVQPLGFAAAAPAERAAVADVVPPGELGMAYGWVSAARMSGLIVGPALGGLLAVFGRWTVFLTTGVALALAAAVAAIALGPSVRRVAGHLGRPKVDLRSGRGGLALRGVLILT